MLEMRAQTQTLGRHRDSPMSARKTDAPCWTPLATSWGVNDGGCTVGADTGKRLGPTGTAAVSAWHTGSVQRLATTTPTRIAAAAGQPEPSLTVTGRGTFLGPNFMLKLRTD